MEDMLLTPHFTLTEFTKSATAQKYGIDNAPPPEMVDNLQRLCQHTLEPLREALGLPIVITSGYRCKALNDIISHHAHRSQHMRGLAADFYVTPSRIKCIVGRVKCIVDSVKGKGLDAKGMVRREVLVKAFQQIITDPKIDYDQLILYPSFIHVSYVSREANRHNIITANSRGCYQSISRETALTIKR